MNFKQVLIFVLGSIILSMLGAASYEFGLKPFLNKKLNKEDKKDLKKVI